ncbi:isocitrate/isopropylmalate dehydrogenase family protein [Actinophytocola oryzae]|uniref:Isocitrate dehydrogenase (NAD+) n=1 Tax=Actinophytocola oryzae TaxID=502181 RepID=A0A4R7W1E5_9PSEU|nr:isocitrate/isopropylmalate family dehydrogenase [Actinophytocola oryzae]TDV56380.1 isocitrate dehydrogenase (NAD+) [Actinophytocola oryzae]
MAHTVVHVPGDGIGPEVTWAARRVIDAAGVEVDWVLAEAGEVPFERTGATVPPETVAAIREVGVVLKGPMANPVGHGYKSPNIALRQAAGVHTNVRLAWALPGARTHFPGADLVVVREVTEDVFTGATQYVGPDAAITVKWVTRAATHRVARFALEYARTHGRKKVTVAHKAATLKETDGLFLAAAREVAPEYPDIELDDCLVDALTMHLVRDPFAYDVLLAPFQYGDILADLSAGLIGGLGLVPGASFGPDAALFEAAHGSAPRYAGQDKVNPTALVLSGALLLDHLGETEAATRVRAAVAATVAGPITTYDLGGTATTTEMTDAIIAALPGGA